MFLTTDEDMFLQVASSVFHLIHHDSYELNFLNNFEDFENYCIIDVPMRKWIELAKEFLDDSYFGLRKILDYPCK